MTKSNASKQKKGIRLVTLQLQYLVPALFTLAVAGSFAGYWYWWKSQVYCVSCACNQGKVVCVNETLQNPVEPEKVFGTIQKQKLYDGDGMSIHFTGDVDSAMLEPIEVPGAGNFNFNRPAHRKKVDIAALEFTSRVAKMRNPSATVETLVIVPDLTSGADPAYRAKLGEYLQVRLTQNLAVGKFTDIRLFGCMQTPELHSLNLSQVISSQVGVNEFVQSLPTQIPDSRELPSSPLVESLWTIFREFRETPNLAVLFYSDLEQNTKTISFIREDSRRFLTNPNQLTKAIDQTATDFGKIPQVPNLQRIEILAMPGSKPATFQQLQLFWLEVLARNRISPDQVSFLPNPTPGEAALSTKTQPGNNPH